MDMHKYEVKYDVHFNRYLKTYLNIFKYMYYEAISLKAKTVARDRMSPQM